MPIKKINVFFKELGFPVYNPRWSWGAHNKDGVLLRTWADEFDDSGKFVRVLGSTESRASNQSPGLPERIDHLRMLWAGGFAGYAVTATAVDVQARPRDIESYDSSQVHAIQSLMGAPDGSIWAELGDTVLIENLLSHAHRHRLVPAIGGFPHMRKSPKQFVKKPAAYVAKLPAIRDWLINVARLREPVTYAEARKPFELKTFEHRHAMDAIGHQCIELGEPILTSLIVDEKTRRCSPGFAKEFNCDDEQERLDCYSFWSADGYSKKEDIQSRTRRFALVEGRPEQSKFRTRVFLAHNGACLVTGCDATQALDAAHRHGREWRLGHNRAEDGWLLRKDIHALYDAKLIRISDSGQIEFDASLIDHYKQFA